MNMSRLNLLHQLDGLLESCKSCKKPYAAPEIKCNGCNIYPQIREIGNRLEGGKEVKKADISKEGYLSLKGEGLSDKDIAERLNVSSATLWNYKSKWKKDSDGLKLAKIAKKNTSNVNTPKLENNAKIEQYESEIRELKERIENMQSMIIDKNGQIIELTADVEKYKNIDSACDDIESEITKLRDENHALKTLVKLWMDK